MNEKIYPKAVVLKRGIQTVIIAGVLAIVLLIVFNFYRSSNIQENDQEKNSVKKVEKTATSSDADWYKNQPVERGQPVARRQIITTTANVPAATNTTAASDPNTVKEQESLFKAMSASINTNQLVADPKVNNKSDGVIIAPSSPSQNDTDQNKQAQKAEFMKENAKAGDNDYLMATLKNPMSPYEIQAGTIIPGVLVTGINSDLPGQITAQVKSNVYDSISGNYLLIPQGAKLVGAYDAQVAYGQERVLIAWKRVIFPNGQSIDLHGMPGVDMSGYAGFSDQVNNHYTKIFGSVLLMSILSAGPQLAQPQNTSNGNNNYPTVNQTMAQSLGNNISAVGTAMTVKNLNIQPTLEIRQGYEFNITVTKDMVFDDAYQVG